MKVMICNANGEVTDN